MLIDIFVYIEMTMVLASKGAYQRNLVTFLNPMIRQDRHNPLRTAHIHRAYYNYYLFFIHTETGKNMHLSNLDRRALFQNLLLSIRFSISQKIGQS